MSDQLGLHRVENASEHEVAVSLHLYTVRPQPFVGGLAKRSQVQYPSDPTLTFQQPPNAAKHGCHIFDARTGKKSHVQQCHFYSEFGVQKDGLA